MDNKVIIFDFDHTLYGGEVKIKRNYYYNMLRNAFDNLDNKQFKELLRKYNIKDKKSLTSDIVVDISVKEGKDTFNKVSYYMAVNNEEFGKTISTKTIDNEVFKSLVGDGYKLFIVSNSPQESVVRNAQALGIDLDLVTILGMPYRTPQRFARNGSKMPRYQNILDVTNTKPQNAYVFGNSYVADILPAKYLNMRAITCNDPTYLTYENILDCVNDDKVENIEEVLTEEYQILKGLRKTFKSNTSTTYEHLLAKVNDKKVFTVVSTKNTPAQNAENQVDDIERLK